MSVGPDPISDGPSDEYGSSKPLASWYTPGFSDRLGDRLLMFDNTKAPAWELLRLKPEFATKAGFENALREQVARLGRFRHPSFATVRSVESLGSGEGGLAIVSTYIAGKRLSEALGRPRSAAFATRLIHQLTPALAELHQQGPGIAHGALSADRILLAPDGRLIIREYVLGSAFQSLGLSPTRLWADLGVVVVPTDESIPRLDDKSDLTQLALVALSLMLGCRIGPWQYPTKLEELLDRAGETAGGQAPQLYRPLRRWLERAFHLGEEAFESAREADDALRELPEDSEGARAGHRVFAFQPQDVEPLVESSTSPDKQDDQAVPVSASLFQPNDPLLELYKAPTERDALVKYPEEEPLPDAEIMRPGDDRVLAPRDLVSQPAAARARSVKAQTVLRWATAAVALLALGEAAVIGRLLHAPPPPAPPPADAAVVIDAPQPGATVLLDDQLMGVTPIELKVGPRTHSIRVLARTQPMATELKPLKTAGAVEDRKTTLAKSETRAVDTVPAPARPDRPGGITVSSPIALQVFEDEQLLGYSGKTPIVASAGRHELDLVNSALGYRVRRVVDIGPGQVVSLTLPPAKGSVSINALPWAEVFVDGKSVGETPLANLSLTLGEHEIVFRHPQLGERREIATVRSDTPTRVIANLQQ